MLALARLASLALFALSLFTFVHAASPAARRAATNAERLARGLAPARPKRLYNPSRANVARSAPSGLPGSTQTGRLGIYPAGTSPSLRKRDGTLGFMGPYGLVPPGSSEVWTYTFSEPASSDTLLELNHAGTPYRLAGVAIRTGPQVTLGPGNTVYLELQNVRSHTDAGTVTPVYVYDTYAIGYAQTTIFSIDQSTGKLTVHWVNPDGTVAQQYIILAGTNIYVTGDVSALQAQLGAAQLNPIDIFFDVPDS
ncbi:hypothetical protein GY45DRAFT_840116 [Cubamyces sp. BRFM 1775]|nr:hypothetical protein GY45DRAFT_840116 [Cubamyces sp. BRFM 1775]